MDADEIRTLLGEMVFERAQKYRRRILQSSCTTNEDLKFTNKRRFSAG